MEKEKRKWTNRCHCKKCGIEFLNRKKNTQFCSQVCRRKFRKEHPEFKQVQVRVRHDKTCVYCGRAFTAKRITARACSSKCGHNDWYDRNKERSDKWLDGYISKNRERRNAKTRAWSIQPLFADENAIKKNRILPPEAYLRPGQKIPAPISIDSYKP
jgi:hypothetical protein